MFVRAVRFFASTLVNLLYRLRIENAAVVPRSGAAVLVANHVSYLDAVMIAGSTSRPISYVMDHAIYNSAPSIFKALGAIPIGSKSLVPDVYADAMATVSDILSAGGIVCIFPEGKITRCGNLNEFRSGVLKILAKNPVPVIPISIAGMWGSYFSFRWGNSPTKMPRHFRAKIDIVFHPALPATSSLDDMKDAIASRL